MESGVNADIIVCRTEKSITDDLRSKIALFCNVDKNSVIESIDAKTIYEVPLLMQAEKLDKVVLNKLNIKNKKKSDLNDWKNFVDKLNNPKTTINIGLIGKYVELQDSYKSILESFVHAGAVNEAKVNVVPIHSEEINDKTINNILSKVDGILVAPGFGERGIEGKILSIKYARENNLPFLGICLGMQMAVIEFARNVLGLKDANSTEMSKSTKNPVISLMNDQLNVEEKGGTMRLGSWKCKLKKNSLAYSIYKKDLVSERHRHRYELNFKYNEKLNKLGMISSGTNPKTGLVEIVEIPSHSWFIGVQFHPEYQSTVKNPHPIFVSFVSACIKKNNQ
jgi:CTP synthase